MCGELGFERLNNAVDDGSSPRVRGTPEPVHVAHGRVRFIPACAGNSRRSGSAWSSSAVHPRVCGELAVASARIFAVAGFIPACAGNSKRRRRGRRGPTVHPRVCGELFAGGIAGGIGGGSSPRVRGTRRFGGGFGIAGRGSSPRVRGTRCGPRRLSSNRRFIPACAGNSAVWEMRVLTCIGSSPRVRGTRPARLRRPSLRRFIPACAGNSTARRGGGVRPAVHPRVCGELSCVPALTRRTGGSSPRVRGTHGQHRGGVGAHRFIPACAGNSGGRKGNVGLTTVHPRVCGELSIPLHPAPSRFGSSPRVRGTRCAATGCCGSERFIPACAGNSSPFAALMFGSAVHPRVCGELERPRHRHSRSRGSSPRVRGTRRLPENPPAAFRFIPACAGNSARRSR